MVDDYTQGTFNFEGHICPEAYEAREICGWPIFPEIDEPWTRPPVSCTHGSTTDGTAGGGPGGCEILHEGCSDGQSYGVICDPSTNGTCACFAGSEQTFSSAFPDSICPYIHGPDMGAVAMNYACGFSVMTPILE